MIEASISVGDPESLVLILGTKDQHLKQIREAIPANISTRDGKIYIHGNEHAVIQATTVLEELRTLLARDVPFDTEEVQQIIRRVTSGEKMPRAEPISVRGGRIDSSPHSRPGRLLADHPRQRPGVLHRPRGYG